VKCSSIMKTDVAAAHENDRIYAAAAMMRDKNVGFLPVLDLSNRVVGTVTDRDLALRVVADGIDHDRMVAEVMTQEVVAVAPDDDIDAAEELMMREQKSRIMVIDQGVLVGVISLSDIAVVDAEDRAGQVLADVADREVRH
jgi:CBS domain-containing protein